MKIGDILERNKTVVFIVCGILILVGVTLIMRAILGPGGSSQDYAEVGQAWYYVPNADHYFLDSVHKLPPIKDDQGRQAVRAYYFSCGPCSEESKFVGYYERFPDEIKKQIEEEGLSEDLLAKNEVSLDGKTWGVRSEPEGRKILQSARLKCDENQKLYGCEPQ